MLKRITHCLTVPSFTVWVQQASINFNGCNFSVKRNFMKRYFATWKKTLWVIGGMVQPLLPYHQTSVFDVVS